MLTEIADYLTPLQLESWATAHRSLNAAAQQIRQRITKRIAELEAFDALGRSEPSRILILLEYPPPGVRYYDMDAREGTAAYVEDQKAGIAPSPMGQLAIFGYRHDVSNAIVNAIGVSDNWRHTFGALPTKITAVIIPEVEIPMWSAQIPLFPIYFNTSYFGGDFVRTQAILDALYASQPWARNQIHRAWVETPGFLQEFSQNLWRNRPRYGRRLIKPSEFFIPNPVPDIVELVPEAERAQRILSIDPSSRLDRTAINQW